VGPPNLRTAFAEDFESYAPGPPYEQPPYEVEGSPWIEVSSAYDGRIYQSSWAHGGARSFMLRSYTTSSEVAYVALELAGPPRHVVIEVWYTPSGTLVYKDFAEFGLGFARSKYELAPTVALEVNHHVLEFRAEPERPIASTNGYGGTPGASKPPAQELFHEVLYASCSPSSEPPTCPPLHNYVRIELDFCADAVSAFVGEDASAPLGGTGTFDGRKAVNAFYLAGGMNPTYIDDIVVSVDDG
jgi:hypothetical protein